MTVRATSGTCVSVSITAPATHNTAGFDALTWTQLGELESVGDVAIQHASVNFANLCTGKTTMLKGTEEGISIPIGVGLDRDDAGQVIMTAARASLTQVLSIKIAEANGDMLYMRAYVMGETITYGDGNSVKRASYTLGVVAPSTGDTIVVKNAV